MSLLRPAAPRHPDPEPLELDDTRVVLAGTLLWAAGLVVLVVCDLAGMRVPGWWLQMCLAGIALGLLGLRVVARRKAAMRRRRSAPPSSSRQSTRPSSTPPSSTPPSSTPPSSTPPSSTP